MIINCVYENQFSFTIEGNKINWDGRQGKIYKTYVDMPGMEEVFIHGGYNEKLASYGEVVHSYMTPSISREQITFTDNENELNKLFKL